MLVGYLRIEQLAGLAEKSKNSVDRRFKACNLEKKSTRKQEDTTQ